MSRRRRNTVRNRVRRAFDRPALKRVCEMYELDFEKAYPDLECVVIEDLKYENFYYFADRGSDILFVAHLDTVVSHANRHASFAETKAGPVIHSGALDDRLGAYIGLELLPALGLNFDILLTVGEESGKSTAAHFETDKKYKWMIEFDRKEDDVVMYCFHDFDTAALVRACGAAVGHGSFSDIAYLEDLGIKGFNWGTGYTGNYHSVKGYAYLEDTYTMVAQFVKFHEQNKDTFLPHTKKPKFVPPTYGDRSGGSYGGYTYGGGGAGGRPGSTPRSDSGKPGGSASSVWVAGRGWVEKGVQVNGTWYASYEDWWNIAHPDDRVGASDEEVADVLDDLLRSSDQDMREIYGGLWAEDFMGD